MSLAFLGLISSCLVAQVSTPTPTPNPTSAPSPIDPPIPLLAQPAYDLAAEVRGPLDPYVPQPGDIFLATDRAYWSRVGHLLCGGKGVHHSGIVFARPDGTMAVIEAGPFNSTLIEVMDPYEHMANHIGAGDKVWIRRRRVPLTPAESAALTAFLTEQHGKRFATWRMLAQVTPLRCRGRFRTRWLGKPHGDRESYYCAELVVESLAAVGLVDPETARPSAMYPRDLFFGRSSNPFINEHLDLEPGWYPPARWFPSVQCVPPTAIQNVANAEPTSAPAPAPTVAAQPAQPVLRR
jgi:hypothetical protein